MWYSKTYIYILNFEYTFQYLFAWKTEVYRQEIIITPVWSSWRRWAWSLGWIKSPYSKDQLDQSEQVILSGAMKSIDLLVKDKSGAKRRKAKQQARKSNSKCQWQARKDEEGKPIWLCLTHNKTAKFGKNPRHD